METVAQSQGMARYSAFAKVLSSDSEYYEIRCGFFKLKDVSVAFDQTRSAWVRGDENRIERKVDPIFGWIESVDIGMAKSPEN